MRNCVLISQRVYFLSAIESNNSNAAIYVVRVSILESLEEEEEEEEETEGEERSITSEEKGSGW